MPHLPRLARRPRSVAALAGLAALACGGEPAAPVPGFTVISGKGQQALAGTTLGTPIVVKLRKVDGSAAAAERVVFRLTGDGTLADTVGVTDDEGKVTAPRWTLGTSAGNHSMVAAAGGFSTSVTAEATSNFTLEVRFFGTPPAADQRQLFVAAAQRIRGVVTGAVPPVPVQLNLASDSACSMKGLPVVNETMKGMVVFAAVDSIDGRGKTLAQAGGCLLRRFVVAGDSVQLPLVGIMVFDRDDWSTMLAQGNLQDVITHEMLHLVGVGRSMWVPKKLLRDEGTPTVSFIGSRAIKGCQDANGATVCGTGVPVENTGSAGTVGTHWREITFGSELMTGFADKCVPGQPCRYPLSGITAGALQDIGYVVNFAAADSYSLPFGAQARVMTAEPGVEWERPLAIPTWEVLPSGERRRVKPRP
ncbi:MAG: leishmanolysin-related zinc metalloendopeptidase [Gemmatimonadaceae bacterium]